MADRRQTAQVEAPIQGREDAAVARFHAALLRGQHWFDALLDAIASWTTPHEVHEGREYHYLVRGEAFDWLLLAERLISGSDGLVPREESEALLFHGRLPRPLTEEEWRDRIGTVKHRAVINFWYGVQVEQALALAVEGEVRKARRGMAEPEDGRLDDMVYTRIYGRTRRDLLQEFYATLHEVPPDRVSLDELREFTYWLFKYRVQTSEPAKLASDTRKGIECLRGLGKGQPYAGP